MPCSYRSDADTLGEAVVSLDVLVQLFDSLFSQRGAVVGFVHVQHHFRVTNTTLETAGGRAPVASGKVLCKVLIRSKVLYIVLPRSRLSLKWSPSIVLQTFKRSLNVFVLTLFFFSTHLLVKDGNILQTVQCCPRFLPLQKHI